MTLSYVDGGTQGLLGGGSTVTFSPGDPNQVAHDCVWLWDFDNDGDFDEGVEDITSYVLSCETSLGRDWPSQLNGKASPGMLSMRLRNDDDRFSFFNADSPLNTSPFSLSVGRKLRIRSSNSTDNEPPLLVKDRFTRSGDSLLGTTETGQTWSNPTTDKFEIGTGASSGRAVAATEGGTHQAVVDVGATDYYAQVVLRQTGERSSGVGNNRLGLCYRYQDSNDYSLFVLDLNDGELQLIDVVAGVETVQDTSGVDPTNGMTLGVRVIDDEVFAFLDGVFTIDGTGLGIQTDETEVGIYAEWGSSNRRPELDDFYVWEPFGDSRIVSEGTIWTGYITEVLPDTAPGPEKYATVRAEGVMSQLASQEVSSPRYHTAQGTGFVVGRILSEAQFLLPPGWLRAIDNGTRPTGPVSFPDDRGSALEYCRRFEDHEIGFLHEAPEGHVEFNEFTHREQWNGTPESGWSDVDGAQFGYETIELLNWSRELVNRVEGGIAPARPTRETATGGFTSTAAGVAADLSYTIPSDVEDGELLIFIVSSTVVASSSADWPVPIWWVPERRDIQDNARGCRIFTHISDGTDGGTVVTFYDDTGNAGGSHIWFAHRFKPGNWYGSHEGIHLAEFRPNSVPPLADPPWGAVPTYYFAIRSGVISSGGASVGATVCPIGFDGLNSEFVNGSGSNGFDNALQYATRIDNPGVIKPTGFDSASFVGFIRVESCILMIRGFNGDPPPSTEVTRETVDDVTSQDRHNRIATYKASSDLFQDADQVEDFAAEVFDLYAEDRPIFRISFTANKNSHYLTQAQNRRVNDRVTLVANANSGMGITGDYFIERIENSWDNGETRWVVTWDLSPAPSRTIDGPV